jgi:AraC family transcriptional regulator
MDYLLLIQDSLNYIENNLTDDISLERLAKRANYSAYYFHRLFQTFVGEPVMEYVRRMRLLSAADELIYSDDNIIDIALKYCFNSQDVFGRAFKRLYSVTPNEYRKINKSLANLRKKINTQEVLSMYDINIGQKLQCTNIEKKECLETLNRILEFSATSRNEGLLALDQEIEKLDSYFMRKALMFVTEGLEPESIRTILQNYIIVGDYKGKALLERILILEGVLLIQAGENPLIIKEKLSSYFGEDFIPEIEKYFNDNISPDDRIKAYYDRIKDVNPRLSENAQFEETLSGLSSRSLQRLLRDMDMDDLINILSYAGGKLQKFFLDNLSKKIAITIINELSEAKNIQTQQVIASQNKILDIVKKLKEDGEII